MSNQSNQSNVAKAPAFKATFVAANNGLQTEQRVHGRRAFPSNKGPQPQLGETWMVEVAGENPKGTVHFVKCLERVSAKPVAAVIEAKVEGNVAVPAPALTQSIAAKPEPVKHIHVVRAPGNDVFARIHAWAAPSKTVALGDLKFAFAKKRVESDETARSMFTQLGSTMATVRALQEIADSAEGKLKQVNSTDHDIGVAIFEARKVMAQMEVDKANLAKETLAYARLVARLNKQLKIAPDDQLAQLVATTKEALDSKRAAHNVAMDTAKEQVNHANTGVFFCYHEDTVKAVLEQLEIKANYSEQAASNRTQLEAELTAFEQYVSTLT
ncbi:hypothetical protein BH11CYA1_BH11CYA1_07870 [soil metagenome]